MTPTLSRAASGFGRCSRRNVRDIGTRTLRFLLIEHMLVNLLNLLLAQRDLFQVLRKRPLSAILALVHSQAE